MCHSSSWSPLLSSQVYLVSPEHEHLGKNKERHYWNIAKGTTDPRVEFISQVAHKSWSNFILQNLEQVSTSKSQTSRLKLNLKILAKPSFRISTKIQITSTRAPVAQIIRDMCTAMQWFFQHRSSGLLSRRVNPKWVRLVNTRLDQQTACKPQNSYFHTIGSSLHLNQANICLQSVT